MVRLSVPPYVPSGQGSLYPLPVQKNPTAQALRSCRAPGTPTARYPGPTSWGEVLPSGQYTVSLVVVVVDVPPQGVGDDVASPTDVWVIAGGRVGKGG